MIPTFPNFKRLSLDDRAEVQTVVEQFPPYSDFNFANLWCYDTHRFYQLSKLHGNLVVLTHDYISGRPFLAFLGDERVVETIACLLDYAGEHGLSPQLRFVPETSIRPHQGTLEASFSVQEDRDNFDYILNVTSLLSKRRNIEKLRRDQPRLTVAPLDISQPSVADNVRALCETWRAQKGWALAEFATERLAIERCLRFAPHFQFQTYGAMIGESLVGFTVNETVHDGYYMGHFGKCDPQYRGLCELLESETACFMRERGCLQMNFQQDLGLLGLRRYKQAWMPNTFLKKYQITPRHPILAAKALRRVPNKPADVTECERNIY